MSATRRKFLQQIATSAALPIAAPLITDQLIFESESFKSDNIKIGFNLLAWSAHVSDELFPMVTRLKKIGFDGIELAMASPDIAAYKRMGKLAKDLSLETNCVLAIGQEENPASDSKEIRQKALDKIKWAIDRAHDLEAKIICGPFHSAFAYFTRKPPSENELIWSSEVLRSAGDYAKQANIVLALEALNRFECYLCNTISQIIDHVVKVGHPNVKAMFDTHHANMEEKKYADAINLCAPMLAHVHISENDRGTPGSGHVPWDDTFSSLARNKYRGWLTIESFTRNDPEFANAINVWREYDKPWDVAEKGIRFVKDMCVKYNL